MASLLIITGTMGVGKTSVLGVQLFYAARSSLDLCTQTYQALRPIRRCAAPLSLAFQHPDCAFWRIS
jgi:hypothetical protein